MVSELERMGDLSVHVAKIARLRVPDVAVPERAAPDHERMAEVAEDMVGAVAADHRRPRRRGAPSSSATTTRRWTSCAAQTFTELLSADWTHGVEAAVDIALLGRYYERIADHAVSVANRVVFVVTGEPARRR